ncbi:hypothetical protein FRC14_003512 [Serendipita sp. 396]|nr:hypothetical protein FRC14_003512 [Serendipita sp. 396]KAG8775281.1 hypothetical protein FRC15_000659 [Serendipita sp. 397]KAG8792883.1 hypothetical protein FRC16_011227 [Serendipita sp. 398]KAG8831516.1 hypothetical protein FRC18_006407 [Serendipita sp. 400]KAG8863636.1 hypothetical protein FRC20_010645 [Serendipita sp. 405]
MFATAGLVASVAIPVSSTPASTSTSRTTDTTVLPDLVKRYNGPQILDNPFSEKISHEENKKMWKWHENVAETHNQVGDNWKATAEIHEASAKSMKKLQDETEIPESKFEFGQHIAHHQAYANEAKHKAEDSYEAANTHMNFGKAHYNAMLSKQIGSGSHVQEGYAQAHEALEGLKDIPRKSTDSAEKIALNNAHQERMSRRQKALKDDRPNADARMDKMAAAYQQKLDDKKGEPFPAPAGAITRAKSRRTRFGLRKENPYGENYFSPSEA